MAIWQRRVRLAGDFISAAVRYWLGVYPYVHREIYHWRLRAQTMASPDLRLVALENLHAERTNLEGAAAFAAFSRRAFRPRVVHAQVAFQAAYDYADTLAEQPSAHPMATARQLHLSLLDAVQQRGDCNDYYAYRGDDDDGGYLVTLVDTVRTALAGLPAYQEVSRSIRLGAARIVDYQSRVGSPDRLSAWVKTETPAECGLAWWETAAACGSSMLVFVLMARAAGPMPGLEEIARIEHAYFPWIGALHTLLDSLVDHADDVASGRPSLLDHYGSPTASVERLSFLTTEARRRAEALPRSHGHALILAAMMSSYLSSPEPAIPHARLARVRLAEMMGGMARPALAVFRLRRLVTRV